MNKDEVKRFTAFANYYRRFIRNFAELAAPLNKLTEFIWSKDCEQSFNKIKQILTSPPLLQFPDFSKKFIVTESKFQRLRQADLLHFKVF